MGKLILTVIGCKNLTNTETFGKADPYVKVQIGSKKFQTKVVNNNLDPNYNEQFTFFVADPQRDILVITVMDKDTFKDDEIGHVSVALAGLTRGKKWENWLQLQQKNGQPAGEIGIVLLAEDFGKDPAAAPPAAVQVKEEKTHQVASAVPQAQSPAPQPPAPAQQPAPAQPAMPTYSAQPPANTPPPQQQAPPQPQYAPQPQYPPQQQPQYPPPQQQYPPPQPQYPPPQQQYPPPQQQYPPPQQQYPPPQQQYPPPQQQYPPPQPQYPPQQQYPPPQQQYPPPQQQYPPPFGGYPPAQPGYGAPQPGYPGAQPQYPGGPGYPSDPYANPYGGNVGGVSFF